MHDAIVKCNRKEIIWTYWNNISSIEKWKDEYFRAKNNDGYYQFRSIIAYKVYWEDAILNNGIGCRAFTSGECVIWEGEVNQERLRIDDYLFIPSLNDYFKINKVETTPNGEIMYYIDYEKLFSENGEKSKLVAIEEWLKDIYPKVEKYEDMKEYRYDIDEYKKEFEERDNEEEINDIDELNVNKEVFANHSTSNYRYEQTLDDLNWEKVMIICGISAVVIVGIMLMIGLYS